MITGRDKQWYASLLPFFKSHNLTEISPTEFREHKLFPGKLHFNYNLRVQSNSDRLANQIKTEETIMQAAPMISLENRNGSIKYLIMP